MIRITLFLAVFALAACATPPQEGRNAPYWGELAQGVGQAYGK
ncbi:hypothetical protein OSH11_11595 [Kaistia dalseonensis]|uniref:Lipoprotein YajG n=1 Tax=Kaistia dalseonensis TaxID=410840 RepID=A0ABU0H8W4_9HYPH|nr:hypothetical protein [Kaistia dalseonensis]MCX5495353.1 hypothetical protein [Kaistia dalseonensis]MDQ0437939.1 putative lipoprotein YajG [Kaistia dalseonensis]